MSKFNYFFNELVDAYDFPTIPQVNFDFNSEGFTLINRGLWVIQYSFDGSTLHGDLDPSDATKGLAFDARTESKIWFRVIDGYSIVRVEAWSGR